MSPSTTGPASAPARTPRSRVPTLREERRLLRDGASLVGGVDEVGRGALAGPVTVGVVVVDPSTRSAPTGLRDSKLLTPAAREALVPRLRRWATGWAVGHAEAHEIDAVGILAALRLAGHRALAQLDQVPDRVILDGSYDWLTRPEAPPSLFDVDAGEEVSPQVRLRPDCVSTLVKGDLRCAAVAAASVLAKTRRDALMRDRDADHPGYGWALNKGYSAPEHLDALSRLGPCAQHRRSWRLPGCADTVPGREPSGPADTTDPVPTADLLADEGMMVP